MITPEMLTGQSTEHLAVLCGNHRLQPEAVKAFQAGIAMRSQRSGI
jgi:hypothetical protein